MAPFYTGLGFWLGVLTSALYGYFVAGNVLEALLVGVFIGFLALIVDGRL